MGYRRVSTRVYKVETRVITVGHCSGHGFRLVGDDTLAAEGLDASRRRKDKFSSGIATQMQKDLTYVRAFGPSSVPTSDKELPRSIRYAQVACVSRHCWAITLGDLVRNLRAPESMERRHPSQYLDVMAYFNMGPDTSESRGTCRIVIPNAYTSASFDGLHLGFPKVDGDSNSGAMNGIVPPPSAELLSGSPTSSYAIVVNPKSAKRARTGLSEVMRTFAYRSACRERVK